jgi:hypothetical protein
VRYIKASNYDAAAELLAGGATALLRAGAQQGASASGGDLAIMLVTEVYNKAEWEISGDNDGTEGRARKSELFGFWLPIHVFMAGNICWNRHRLTCPTCRAFDRAFARVPIGRAYEEEVYPGDDWMEWALRTAGARRSGAAPRCRFSLRGRFVIRYWSCSVTLSD